MEEFHQLDSVLADTKRVEFADKELTQAEKDEIDHLKKELQSTRLQLDDLQYNADNTSRFLQDTTPFGQSEFAPAELEMIRATVVHENKHKYNLEQVSSLEGKF